MTVGGGMLRLQTPGHGHIVDLTEGVARIVATNSHAHLRAALIGPSETIPVLDGRLTLGTWQQIVLIGFDDRPRDRTVSVQVLC